MALLVLYKHTFLWPEMLVVCRRPKKKKTKAGLWTPFLKWEEIQTFQCSVISEMEESVCVCEEQDEYSNVL